jgi:N-acetylneuraminic acid mutarotase
MRRESLSIHCTIATIILALSLAVRPAYAQSCWTLMAPMPAPRVSFGAATAANGRIYVLGGVSAHSTYDTVFAYDPDRNTWTSVAPLSSPRAGIAVVAGPDGRIYAIGGMDGSGNSVRTVEAYDPVANKWTGLAGLPVGRRYLDGSTPAAVGGDGKIYVFGGEPSPPVPGDPVRQQVYAYDIKQNNWESRNPAPYGGGPATAAGPDGRIYASFGNVFGFGSNFSVYDPSTDTWTSLPPQPGGRVNCAMIAGLDGKLYLVGGSYFGGIAVGWAFFDNEQVYDPASSVWLPLTPTHGHYGNAGLSGSFGATSGPDGRICHFSGHTGPDFSAKLVHLAFRPRSSTSA